VKSFLAEQARDRRTVAERHRAAQISIRQGIDLECDQPAPAITRSTLSPKCAILQVI
jgi:hypothetical protein